MYRVYFKYIKDDGTTDQGNYGTCFSIEMCQKICEILLKQKDITEVRIEVK